MTFGRVVVLCLVLGWSATPVVAQSAVNLNSAVTVADTLKNARQLLDAGLTATAKPLLEEALQAYPEQLDIKLLLAQVWLLEGNTEQAQAILQRLGNSVMEPEYFWLLGLLEAELGRSRLALQHLEQAATVGRLYRYAMDWAATAWRFGDTKTALAAYRQAVLLDALQPWPRINQAMILYYQNQYTQALYLLNQALSSLERNNIPSDHPAYPEVYYWLGMSQLAVQQPEEAKHAFRLALKYDENYSEAKQALQNLP